MSARDLSAPPARSGNTGSLISRNLVVCLILMACVVLTVWASAFFPDSSLNHALTFEEEAFFDEARDELLMLAVHLSRYFITNGDYPTTEQGLDALAERPSLEPVPASWSQKVEALPPDPWDRPYQYEYRPGEDDPGDRIRLYSLGPDDAESDDDVRLPDGFFEF